MGRFEGGHLVAFVVGLVFIALFAWDRLNRRLDVDQSHKRQQRFVELLAPSKLLRTATFLRGVAVYYGLLALLYLVLCSVGEPLFLAVLQSEKIGYDGPLDSGSPIVPLLASLIIIGVLPPLPPFSFLEEHARRLAHRLIGIPDSFNDLADALYHHDLNGSALDRTAAARIDQACAALRKALGGAENEAQFRGDLTKLAVLDWIGKGQVYPKSKVYNQFESIADEVRAQIQAIAEDIEDMVARTDQPQQDHAALARRWNAVLSRLNVVVDDVCALVAIYSENASGLPSASTPQMSALRDWILRARRARDFSQNQFALLLQNLVIVSVVLLALGFVGGALDILKYPGMEGIRWLERAPQVAFKWFLGSVCLYGPTALIGWAMRLRRIANGNWPYLGAGGRDNGDEDALSSAGVFPWGPYMLLFVCCYLTALLGLGLFYVADVVVSAPDQTLAMERFLREATWGPLIVYAVMGAIYASAMSIFFDLHDTHRASLSALFTTSSGLILALAGVAWIASLYHFRGAWGIVWFHTAAGAAFALTVSISTILTLRRLERIDRQREAIRKRRLGSPALAQAVP